MIWLPISDEAHTGDSVLLYCGWGDTSECIVAAFYEYEGKEMWWTLDGPGYLPDWPTHWMPLPEAPAKEKRYA